MKKLITVVLVIITVLSCTACAIFPNYIVKDKVEDIKSLKIERISDGLFASYESGNNNIIKVINELKQVLFIKSGNCSKHISEHVYSITLETDKKTTELFINADGSACVDSTYYAVDFSSQNTLNLSIFERMINQANTTEEEVIQAPEEESPEAATVTVKEIEPFEFSEEIITINESTDIATVNGVRYFTANADVLDENCNILAGENTEGSTTIFYKGESAQTISYVMGSYEQSTGKNIYFNVTNDKGSNKVYFINLETGKCYSLAAKRNSNITLFDTPSTAIMGYGWMVTDDMILAIRLDDNTVNEELSLSIKDDAKAATINNNFFRKLIEGYDSKKTTLTSTENDNITITVTQTSSEGLPDIVTEFTYNCIDKTLTQN